MILVTVGTTEFDELIKAMDEFIESGLIGHVVIAQTGQGEYHPRNMIRLPWILDMESTVKDMDVIISHAGASTIMECLNLQKKLIVVENKNVRRQADELLRKLSNKKYLIWCKNMEELPNFIKIVDEFPFKEYHPPNCQIAEKIIEFLGEDK